MEMEQYKSEHCKNETETTVRSYNAVPEVVNRLLESSPTDDNVDHLKPVPIPSRDAVAWIIEHARRLIYHGYFSEITHAPVNQEYRLGRKVTDVLESVTQQIILAYQHDCYRHDLPCSHCRELGRESALKFIQSLPELREILYTDVQAALDGDPAAKTYDEVIFSYPGLFAVTGMAHKLYELEIPLLPRMMTEHAHSLTGIDIHPGAKIGAHFFIDHGTGVVVGETTEIGSHVRLYQGVTLGALSVPKHVGQQLKDRKLKNRKRHPTVQDDVIIYSNTTVLGGETVIGARSVIGGNIWITESVPPDTKVLLKKPELIYQENSRQE
jgi:serine O-acetyltransferase